VELVPPVGKVARVAARSRERAAFPHVYMSMVRPLMSKTASPGWKRRPSRGASLMTRSGSVVVIGFIFLALIIAATTVIMAVSGQSATSRAVSTSAALGRYATEMSESAIDECLAQFGRFLHEQFPSSDWRKEWTVRGGEAGGVIRDAQVLGVPQLTFSPEKTWKLTKDLQIGLVVSKVIIRPLYYSTLQNYGEIELSCFTTYHASGRRELYRRVTSHHYVVLDAPISSLGRQPFLRVNAVPRQSTVDRSAEQ